jgi:hypothetical protein
MYLFVEDTKAKIETQGFTSIIAAKKVMKVASWDFGRALLTIFHFYQSKSFYSTDLVPSDC